MSEVNLSRYRCDIMMIVTKDNYADMINLRESYRLSCLGREDGDKNDSDDEEVMVLEAPKNTGELTKTQYGRANGFPR